MEGDASPDIQYPPESPGGSPEGNYQAESPGGSPGADEDGNNGFFSKLSLC